MPSFAEAAARASAFPVDPPSTLSSTATPLAIGSISTAASSADPETYLIKHLILDASPLLTQAPIHALRAHTLYLPGSVLKELRDPKARAYLSSLQTTFGQRLAVVSEPSNASLLAVIAFAKRTGDYAVLSKGDLDVLAVAHGLEVKEHGGWRLREEVGGETGQQKHERERKAGLKKEGKHSDGKKENLSMEEVAAAAPATAAAQAETEPEPEALSEPQQQARVPTPPAASSAPPHAAPPDAKVESASSAPGTETEPESSTSVAPGLPSSLEPTADAGNHDDGKEEDSDSDDGEWINAGNLAEHKNLALGIVTEESKVSKEAADRLVAGSAPAASATAGDDAGAAVEANKGKSKKAEKGAKRPMSVATITSDYAVQNVMLQMGLSLISMSGQRITHVKSWVLRCHACSKITKDQERKFCPSCGNPTLLRTSVTSTIPKSGGGGSSKANASAINGSAAQLGLQVHLKPNFQYRNRGTIYSLPAPKPSSSSALKQQPAKKGAAAKHRPNAILREDQLEYQRALSHEHVRREKEERRMVKAIEKSGGEKDAFSARYDDPDWTPEMLLSANSKGRRGAGGLPAVGAGRKNPNERRGPRR